MMRVLGRSGIKVSAVGFGCWAIGGPFTTGGYTHLDRHGEMAGFLRSTIANPSSGDTLQRYAEVVARHATGG